MRGVNTIAWASDRYIGRTDEGARIYISMELRKRVMRRDSETGEPVPFETMDHQKVTEYVELSVSGLEVPKYCRNAYSAGQIDMHLSAKDFIHGEAAIPRSMIREIFELWGAYHLNGMNAHCIHQDKGAHVGDDGWKRGQAWKNMQRRQTMKCPMEYRYGSKHLVKIIPQDAIDQAMKTIETLNRQPEYQGA